MTIREAAAIIVSPNYQRDILTAAMIEAMPTTHHNLRKMRKNDKAAGYAKNEAVKPDGTGRFFSTCQESAARTFEFGGEAGKVYKIIQLANTYKPGKISIGSESFKESGKLYPMTNRETKKV